MRGRDVIDLTRTGDFFFEAGSLLVTYAGALLVLTILAATVIALAGLPTGTIALLAAILALLTVNGLVFLYLSTQLDH